MDVHDVVSPKDKVATPTAPVPALLEFDWTKESSRPPAQVRLDATSTQETGKDKSVQSVGQTSMEATASASFPSAIMAIVATPSHMPYRQGLVKYLKNDAIILGVAGGAAVADAEIAKHSSDQSVKEAFAPKTSESLALIGGTGLALAKGLSAPKVGLIAGAIWGADHADRYLEAKYKYHETTVDWVKSQLKKY